MVLYFLCPTLSSPNIFQRYPRHCLERHPFLTWISSLPYQNPYFFPMVPVLSLLLCPCWTDQILSSTTTSAFIDFPSLKTQNSLTSSRDCIFSFKFSKDKDYKVRYYLTMCFSKMSGTSEHCFQLQTESTTDGMLLERPEYLASAKRLPFLTIASRQLLV